MDALQEDGARRGIPFCDPRRAGQSLLLCYRLKTVTILREVIRAAW